MPKLRLSPPILALPAIPAALALAFALSMAMPAPASAATPPQTIVIARDLNTAYTLDPQEAYEIAPAEIINALYTRLVERDRENFSSVVPGVAASWQISADGKQFTFKIRSGLKFTSGHPVTAGDAAFSLQRGVLLGKPQSFVLTQFGWNRDNVRQAVKVQDDQLVLSFERAYAPALVLNALSTAIAAVVDREEALAHEANGDLGNAWLRGNSAGSGAYRVATWKPKDVAILEANPGFYLGAAKTKTVVVRHVAEVATQRLLLERGDVDIAEDLTADQLEALATNPDIQIQSIPLGTAFHLALNQRNPILAKPEVWQAMRWLIDYDALADNLFKGQFRVSQAFLAPGIAGALPGRPYKYDLAKAKALLAKAGYPDGFRITLDTLPQSPFMPVAQALQASFAKAGIVLDVKQSDAMQVLTRYREGKHDLVFFVKSVDYNDPNAMASWFTRYDPASNNGTWRNNWQVPELTAKTAAAAVERDPQKRLKLYEELQRTIQNDSPFIFVLQQVSKIASRKNVGGYRAGAMYDSGIFDLIEKR